MGKIITWNRVATESGFCWICNSHEPTHSFGRVKLSRGGKRVFLHRYHYEKYVGKIPKGHVVRHKCKRKDCVNPAHLETGTQRQNMKDKFRDGTMYSGERHHQTNLTTNDVKDIRKSRRSHSEIAFLHNISVQCVRNIKKRKTWKWLK